MKPLTVEESIREWRTTLDSVTALGVAWVGTRFDRYLRLMDEVLRLERAREKEGFALFRGNERNLRLVYEGAGQLHQLTMAATVWTRLDGAVLARKLRTVLAGDDLPRESTSGDMPRDTLVELLSAAVMTEYGFEPRVTANEADLELEGNGLGRVVVECKRPTSLPAAVRKVRTQLWRRTATPRGGRDFGMAVFAVEAAFGLPFKRWKARESAEVESGCRGMIERARQQVRGLRRWRHSDITKLSPVVLMAVSGAVWLEGAGASSVYAFCTVRPVQVGDSDSVPPRLDQALQKATANPLLAGYRE